MFGAAWQAYCACGKILSSLPRCSSSARDTLLSTENALSKSKSALSFLHRTSVDLQIGNDRIRRKGGMRATNVVNDSTLRRGTNSFSPAPPFVALMLCSMLCSAQPDMTRHWICGTAVPIGALPCPDTRCPESGSALHGLLLSTNT